MMQASPSKLLWQRFKSHPIAIASLGLLITFAVFAIFAPLIENILDVSATDVDLFNLSPVHQSIIYWVRMNLDGIFWFGFYMALKFPFLLELQPH